MHGSYLAPSLILYGAEKRNDWDEDRRGMFFRRGRKDKLAVVEPAGDAPAQPVQHGYDRTDGPPVRPGGLPASALRRSTDPATLGFKTTAELAPSEGLLGQEQALAALALGATIRAPDHNIVIVGKIGSAERKAVLAELRALYADRGSPCDWVYVADFDNPNSPRVLKVPAGSGRLLASMMDDVIGEIRSSILATLGSDSYQARWRAIDAECQSRHRAGLDAIGRTADAQSIALLRTPMGYAVAPAHQGGVVNQDTFSSMPPTMQADVRAHINSLESELSEWLENAPHVDRERRLRLSDLNRDVVLGIARAALAELRQVFARDLAVTDYLASVETDILANANTFLPTIDISDILGAEQLAQVEDGRFDRYRVNVFVGRIPNASSAPVECDTAPGWAGLFGEVSQCVAGTAPHMRLVAGALHYANGGALLLDARELTASPDTWSALLSCLKSESIRSAASTGQSPGLGLRAPAIPLDVKIILLSDAEHLRKLAMDPRFVELFKVRVAFADSVARTLENERELAKRFADIAAQEGLKPLEAAAVAELIELSSRRAGNCDRLSLAVNDFIPLMWEADVCRSQAAREVTSRADIVKAFQILSQQFTSPDVSLPKFTQQPAGVIQSLVDSSVEAVAGVGTASRLRRVSARLHPGLHRTGLIDINVVFGGEARVARQIASYLAAEFCRDGRIALAATLESHPPVEEGTIGQNATCAELMAILSAIAEIRLPQTIAVAGAFDHFGNLQGGSGINAAVEAFFDLTAASATDGERGVVIPSASVPFLMLRQDILDAVTTGEFKVWSADTVAECFTVLTGQPAGRRGEDGRFVEGDAYSRIEAKLQAFHQQAIQHSSSAGAATP